MSSRIWKRGEITVFLSMLLAVLLFFFQAALESARYAMLRSQTQEALELAEYSVLSEYHREMLDIYGLFYLDLSYGGGAEDTEYLNRRITGFLDANLSEGETAGVDTWDYSRATDGKGTAYYEQAVAYMKQKTGASLLQKLKQYEEYGSQASGNEESYAQADARENQNLEELKKRREEEEEKSTPDPVSNSGAGPRGRNSPGVGNDVFFLAYLLEHFPDAAEYLAEGKESGAWLDYQLEYLIAGKDTDIANLEAVCGRLLAIREGMNYAYLLSDSAKVAECAALAAALVGATMIPGLVEAMKQVLLLAWAFAESVLDVRMLLNGKRTAFFKNNSTWKLSLSGALEAGALSGLDEQEDPEGLLYQDYLGILLTLTGREHKMMRSLDAIEGVIREQSGGHWFYIDQCTDAFWFRAVCTNGQELTAERWIGYEW